MEGGDRTFLLCDNALSSGRLEVRFELNSSQELSEWSMATKSFGFEWLG